MTEFPIAFWRVQCGMRRLDGSFPLFGGFFMYRTFPLIAAVSMIGVGHAALAAPITVVNPGGEAYGGSVNIDIGGVAPLATTGWNSTFNRTGTAGIQSINNNPNSGAIRLSMGVTGGANDPDPTTLILFQETSHVVAEGDALTLDYFGRGFFGFTVGNDTLNSFFGYLDGGNVVQVDVATSTTAFGSYSAQQHDLSVASGSALIGENLVIGFFVDDNGDDLTVFASVDDVSLDVVPIPEPGSIALLAIGGLAIATRRRR